MENKLPTWGLALSGSGNRSTFYIGFLEFLTEQGLVPDYISACSGASLVSAAYACGKLSEFKEVALKLDKENIKKFISRSVEKGGYYSLDRLEEEMQTFTRGLTFEEVRPHMSFISVDIETGEQIVLCMGDIARAARISCTLPGVFEPVKWGGKTLVDGGLLITIPADVLKEVGVEVIIGINMRGTKHIFTDRQINFKKIFNSFKKYLFIDELELFINNTLKLDNDEDFGKKTGLFSVLGKSLDLAILASAKKQKIIPCDLIITPSIVNLKRSDFTTEKLSMYYNEGRKSAEENIPQIRKILEQK